MKAALKEYWEICMKPSLAWCKKHWKGYLVFSIIVIFAPTIIYEIYNYGDYYLEKIENRFSKWKES